MRLGIKLLNCDGDVNKFKEVRTLDLRRGETATVYFALVDLATGNRFVPTSTSTVQITIPRSIIQQGTIGDQRQRLNPTITRAAVKPFSGDWSIWSFPRAHSTWPTVRSHFTTSRMCAA